MVSCLSSCCRIKIKATFFSSAVEGQISFWLGTVWLVVASPLQTFNTSGGVKPRSSGGGGRPQSTHQHLRPPSCSSFGFAL